MFVYMVFLLCAHDVFLMSTVWAYIRCIAHLCILRVPLLCTSFTRTCNCTLSWPRGGAGEGKQRGGKEALSDYFLRAEEGIWRAMLQRCLCALGGAGPRRAAARCARGARGHCEQRSRPLAEAERAGEQTEKIIHIRYKIYEQINNCEKQR